MIGNPPYGAKLSTEDKIACKRIYSTAKTISGVQKGSLDTFSLFIELGHKLLRAKGSFAMIIPLSFISSDSMAGVHRLLINSSDTLRVSSYAVRPEPVFKNAVVDTTILTFVKTETECNHFYSTRLNRKKGNDFSLQKLVENLAFADVREFLLYGRIPKIGTHIECSILKKIRSNKVVANFKSPKGSPIYYRFAGGRYFKVITNYTTNSSAEIWAGK